MDNGLVTFFEVEACGFYRLKQDARELDHKFGDMTALVKDLERWLTGKKFEQTLPWRVEDFPLRVKTYCRGLAIDPDTNDAVIVIYRSVGDNSGNIHGIKVGSAVGPDEKGTIVAGSSEDGEEIIWGQPCYYWIIPEKNKIASIRFPHSSSDTPKLSSYIKDFVNNHSSFGERNKSESVRENPADPTRKIKITRTNFPYGEGKDKCNCIFKFSAKELRLKTLKEDLDQLHERITHTIIRDSITATIPDTRTPFFQIGSQILPSVFGPSGKFEKAKHVEVIVDGSPSRKELYKLYEQQAGEENKDWRNIGFKTEGANGPTTWIQDYVPESVNSSAIAVPPH
ncbi:hypothetical protein [Pontibacterium sp.]|uniref:hypothetical protein n=1 Tax=Pontibacterium sp. TaxID=2036026 RepID=UPI003515AD8C